MKYNPFSVASIGIDIKPEGIWLVRLQRSHYAKTVINLIEAAFFPGSDGVFADGKIKQWDILTADLQNIARRLKLKNAAAAIQVPGHLVHLQRIQTPLGLTDEDIQAEIKSQIKQELLGLADPLCIDYVTQSATQSGYVDVFYAASREDYLTRYMACLKAAGFKLKIIDVDIYAIKRAVHFALLAEQQEAAQAILYIRHSIATLIVFAVHEIPFYQSWELTTKEELFPQFKAQLQLYTTTLRANALKRIALCANREIIDALFAHAEASLFEWLLPNPLTYLSRFESRALNFTNENAFDFLIALGLALRELPKW